MHIPANIARPDILRKIRSASLIEHAIKYPAEWQSFLLTWDECVMTSEKNDRTLETGFFLWTMAFYAGRASMRKQMKETQERITS